MSADDLPFGLHPEVRLQFATGYFYNEEIEEVTQSDFQKSLYAVAKHAIEIEVAARLDDVSPLMRRRVRITQSP